MTQLPAFPRYDRTTVESFPLHAAAEGIYRGQQLDPQFAGYWTAMACEIRGDLDVSLLRRSIEETVREADVLHSRYQEQPHGGVTQEIRGQSTWRLSTMDLSGEENLWRAAQPTMSLLRQTSPSLQSGPLFYSVLYIGRDHALWYVQAHHVVCDGYAYSLLFSQVSRRYRDKMRKGDHFAPLRGLAEDDLAYQEGQQRRDDRAYWTDLLGEDRATSLSEHTALPSDTARSHSFEVTDIPSGAAWPHRLVAAAAALLHNRTGTRRPIIGLPVANRNSASTRVPGMAMNIVPIPVDITPVATVDDLAHQVADTVQRSRSHLRYRYEWLRRDLHLSPTQERLFAPTVNIIPYFAPPQLPGCHVQLHPISAGPVDDLSVTAYGPNRFAINANPELYSGQDLTHIAEELTELLTNAEKPVGQWIELPSEPYDTPLTLTERLDRHVTHRGDHPAIVEGDTTISYRELQQRAEEVAGYLLNQRVTSGDIVALDLPRGRDALIAILGVHYAGAAYLPLDPDLGEQRRHTILSAVKPVVTLSHPLPSGTPARSPASPSDPAYVLFTSGSTGTPKGVVIPHSARDFFIGAALERYGITSSDRMLQFAPLHFDTHVEEIFLTWAVGATLVVRDDSATESLAAFTEFLDRTAITILDLPTAYWHELTWSLHQKHSTLPASIRTVIIGGEAANPQRVEQWHESVSNEVSLINTYGPTEATVVCLASDLRPGEAVNLGRPLNGVKAALGPGNELFLSGPGLASGYLGIDQRFATGVNDATWYATGDIVSQTEQGHLDYRGRKDREIKISGHRIDPLEIEAALLSHPDVTEAAVTTHGSGSSLQLLAYISGNASRDQLTPHLKQRLPDAALPSQLTQLPELPHTPSGKVDYRALPQPEPVTVAHTHTLTEAIVAEVFADVLGSPVDSRTTDFFHSGGTSLKAVAAATRLSATLQREIPASHIFAAPTIADLAAKLDGHTATSDPHQAVRTDTSWTPMTPAPVSGDAIALTGATGFVGSWLAAQLLHTTDTVLHCLTRSDEQRLHQALRSAGARDEQLNRVVAVPADFTTPLDQPSVRTALAKCGRLIHSAAEVSLGRPYASLRSVNTLAVGQLLQLAAESGTAFHHVSTVAVGAELDLAEDFVAQHEGLHDGYQLSKWGAEELLRQAGESGLPVACYRLGRVVPPEGSQVSNAQDLLTYVIDVGLDMQALPELPVWEPWIEVDAAARNIASLAMSDACGVWNLIVDQPVYLADYLSDLAKDHGCALLPLPHWIELLQEQPSPKAKALQAFFTSRTAPPIEATAPKIQHGRFADWLTSESPSERDA